MTLSKTLADYETKSQNPDYSKYSPLFCAIYDGEHDDVTMLLDHYKNENTLQAELSFIGPDTQENILQVAMKHHNIMETCCEAIQNTDPGLFTSLITHTDGDGDTVFHQVAEFGRDQSLNELQTYLKAHVNEDVLNDVFTKENKYGETALQILRDYDGSDTIHNLNLDDKTKNHARSSVDNVHGAFESFKVFDLSAGHKLGM